MKYKGITLENTFPRTILKKAYVNGLLEEEKVWIRLMEDRNVISYIYNEKSANEIAERIKNEYAQAIGNVVKVLKDFILEDE